MISILIVDDDPSIQLIYSKMLSILGYHVDNAKNGEEAVQFCKSSNPNVILMDHRMPIKNGIQATKEILEFNHNLKIIFTSADISIRKEALSIGAISFEEKPFSMKKLKDSIEHALKSQIV